MNKPANDYSQQPVPDDLTVSSSHISLVIIGGTIAIPAFLMAAQLGTSLGFMSAILAFICGAIVLALMIACTSWVGSVTRLSASKLTENAFGLHGAKYINGVMAITLAGWYGVNCKMFGDAADIVLTDMGIELPSQLYMIVGSLLMLWVSLKGFKGIDKLALWLVPLMIFFIIYAAVLSLDSTSVNLLWEVKKNVSFTSGISAVIGAYIVGVVVQPDYSRFAKSAKGAAMGAGLSLLIVFPIVLILTAIPAIVTEQADLIMIMIGIGIGGPAFFLLLLSSWSSNVLSLYSSSLNINTIIPSFSLRNITLFIGAIGTLIAFADVQKYFIDFLIFLGVAIPPVGAIYCLNFGLNKELISADNSMSKNHWSAIYSWIFGTLIGFLSYNNYFSIVQVPSLDSIIFSSLAYMFLRRKCLFNLYIGSSPDKYRTNP